MIILPASTPAVAVDQSSLNQAQQNQVQSSEQSRKATDTVQISPKALELAGTELKQSPTQVAEARAVKQVEEAVEVDKQQPVNPATQKPESNKIDVVA